MLLTTVTLLAAVLVLACRVPAAAQDFERYRPRTIEPPPFEPEIPERPVPPATGSDEVLVKRLDAVIVLDDPAQVEPRNAFAEASGLVRKFRDADSLVYSPAFASIVSAYIGEPVTLRNLNQMSRDIILLYRRSGQPVVDVVIPEQRVTEGTVQIVVIEARVGQVRFRGGHWGNPCRLHGKVRCTQPGMRLHESTLSADLRRLNDYPFRRVELDLDPGAVEGTTDVIFEVHDVFPMRGYVGYEDTGVQNLELERLFVGTILGNPFGRDGLLSYQGTSDAYFNHLGAHSVSYNVDLNDLWAFTAYGSWARVEPIVALGVNQDGESWQAGFEFRRKLIDTQYEQRSVSIGFDFKSTNTNVEFGGVGVFASTAELVSLSIGYEQTNYFGCGEYFRLYNDFYIGPGPQFSPGNETADFNTVRADTDPSFVYNRIVAERLWNLPHCWQFVARGTGQTASERLLFSEMLGYGGYDTIRGYDQRTLNGDAGYIVNLELGPQPYRFGGCRPQTFRPYAFVDLGDAFIIDAVPGEESEKFLISAGVGFRYSLSNRLSLRFDYGHGFSDVPPLASSSTDRVHVGVVGYFGPTP